MIKLNIHSIFIVFKIIHMIIVIILISLHEIIYIQTNSIYSNIDYYTKYIYIFKIKI
jgi:hypothetical protein